MINSSIHILFCGLEKYNTYHKKNIAKKKIALPNTEKFTNY